MFIDEISIAVSKTTVPTFPINLDRKTGIDPIIRIQLYVARIFRIHLKKPELIKISPLEIFFNPDDRKGKISTIKEKTHNQKTLRITRGFPKVKKTLR